MKKFKQIIPYIYLGMILGLLIVAFSAQFPEFHLGRLLEFDSPRWFNNKSSGNAEDVELILSQEVFEYGEGYASIPIYKYVENKEDFTSLESNPMAILNKKVGVYHVVYTGYSLKAKETVSITKDVEVRDTKPAKIEINGAFNPDNPKSVVHRVSDPIDGLLEYKESMNDDDRGCYTVYRDGSLYIVKAIDVNGNLSEARINTITREVDFIETLNKKEWGEGQSNCVLDDGFDGIHYETREEAEASAKAYLDDYPDPKNKPEGYELKETTCDGETYHIWLLKD